MSYDAAGYAAEVERRMALLESLRADPVNLKAAMQVYADDPVPFIDDWGWTYDPRNVEVGMPATIPFLLFPKQRDYLRWLLARWQSREDGLVDKSRDMGASWLGMAFAVWMWRFRPGTAVGVGSRKEVYVDNADDPKSLLWMARKLIEQLPAEIKPRGYSPKTHAPFMKIVNPETGSTIIGEAGDNIGRGARTSLYLVDESAHLERPALVDASLSNTTNCRIDISTPNGPGNPFAIKRRAPGTRVFTLHWRDDPRKGDAWYERMKEKLTPPVLAQEVDIDYEASSDDTLIPGRLVDAAQAVGKADVSDRGPLRMGLDVSRYGSAETVITLMRGRAVLWQKYMRGRAVTDVAAAVRSEIILLGGQDRVGQIAVDDIGVGGGVTDLLREWFDRKGFVQGVNVSLRVDDGINFNLRARMYAELLAWLEDQPNSLPADPELKSQLCSVKYFFRGGLRLLESKEDMMKRGVKSPDRADSLALCFAVPVTMPKPRLPSAPDFGVLDSVAGY